MHVKSVLTRQVAFGESGPIRGGGATVVDYPYLPVFLDHQYFYLLLSFHLEVLAVL